MLPCGISKNVFWWFYMLQISFPSGLFFHFLSGIFWWTDVLNYNAVEYINTFLYCLCFCDLFKNSSLSQSHKDILPYFLVFSLWLCWKHRALTTRQPGNSFIFSSNNFKVLPSIYKPLVFLELSFVYNEVEKVKKSREKKKYL